MNLIHKLLVATVLPLSLALSACGDNQPRNKAVYMLIDTSGTYTQELNKAQAITNYLLATLDSGDSLAIARINSGSFTEKNIVAKTTFDMRPSTANEQKRMFRQNMDDFAKSITRGSSHTDISGGVLQAAQFLHETGAGNKYIFIFSDLEEDLPNDHIRDFPIELDGVHVVAINVTKLRSDNVDPREYLKRLRNWEERVTKNGGDWRVINDLERMDKLIAQQ